MLKAGLIGFGGITNAHKAGYKRLEALEKVKLTCAYDIEPDAFAKKVTTNLDSGKSTRDADIHFYTDLDEMLQNEELDFVDICVPTFKHKELAVLLLARGYNVLCEKPMALNFAQCNEMITAARESGKELMIAQCLRFYPEFEYIKSVIDGGNYGKVLSASFYRLSPPPVWGWQNWFMDYERSGGCITDLHVHDIDIIRYLFGEPDAVSCRAVDECSRYAAAQTSLFYGNTPISAIGDWTRTGVEFSAGCNIALDGATIVYEGGKLTVYPKDGNLPFSPDIRVIDGYTGEIEYFCSVVSGETKNTRNPATSAALSVKLIEAIRKSADNGGIIVPFEI